MGMTSCLQMIALHRPFCADACRLGFTCAGASHSSIARLFAVFAGKLKMRHPLPRGIAVRTLQGIWVQARTCCKCCMEYRWLSDIPTFQLAIHMYVE